MRLESLDSLESLTRLSAYGPHEDILKKTSTQPRRNAVISNARRSCGCGEPPGTAAATNAAGGGIISILCLWEDLR
jgi:hypothetical protein